MAVEFTIEVDEQNLTKAEDIGLLKALKMTSNINTTNIVCFDKNGKIRKYESPEEILKEFYVLRLEYYVKRKVNTVTPKRFTQSELFSVGTLDYSIAG